MAVITISKEYASESEEFARRLADRLGYSILDKQLVADAARELRISESEAQSFHRGKESRLLRLIDRYTASTVQKVVDRSYGRLDDKNYHEVTVKLVQNVGQEGNVIILGWGAQCILADHPQAIHLRIVKHLEDRIRWLKENMEMDDRAAKDLIEREEKESEAYIEHYFNRSWDDPHLYHAVLNLSRIAMEDALDLVAAWVSKVEEGP
ncbi:Cytidylate kinase-like family protein [Desulfacinum hydrothermale DSM 13146]|uniref:Cytidylate kinase-like family protein n=1 Tax=Desulfacinum hydrothermale DSM 13146 TaxID=1121390 RepID=A0A1W1XPB3_9BACT|nr:cytidylate kinase-like family protein [Desulfacinum hydrothermale]SMC25830.1 Cytidylate kinase-like family protein [Desulfacinum hydrothermale DSM 13146]